MEQAYTLFLDDLFIIPAGDWYTKTKEVLILLTEKTVSIIDEKYKEQVKLLAIQLDNKNLTQILEKWKYLAEEIIWRGITKMVTLLLWKGPDLIITPRELILQKLYSLQGTEKYTDIKHLLDQIRVISR